MTQAEFEKITNNQIIIDRKIDRLSNELNSLKQETDRIIHNQHIIGNQNDEILEALEKLNRR